MSINIFNIHIKMKVLLLLLAGYAYAACPSPCVPAPSQSAYMLNGTCDSETKDGSTVCDGASIEISADSSSRFGIPISVASDAIYSDVYLSFTSAANSSANATVRIMIESEGTMYQCGSNSTNTPSNATVVEWVVPEFVVGQVYSTPDLSVLANSVSGCAEALVFVLEGLPESGSRKVQSYETLSNATKLAFDVNCLPQEAENVTNSLPVEEQKSAPSGVLAFGITFGSIIAVLGGVVICISLY